MGSNSKGFHGAGSAGLAMRGDSRNNWREDQGFLLAMQSSKGSNQRIGKWAVYGIARGHQVGREGQSYAIQTIERPGIKRSTTLSAIEEQLVDLLSYANKNQDLVFIMTPVGCGYSGYSVEEMRNVWENATKKFGSMPSNIRNPHPYGNEPKPSET